MPNNPYNRSGWLLCAPALTLMVVILLLPVVLVATLSFTSYSLGGSSVNWVGFSNYEKLFSRSVYEKMFTATFIYVAVVVPLSIALGLGAALLISSLRKGGDFYKTVYFLPVMAALLAMAIVWEFTLHPTIGFINNVLQAGCDSNFWYGLLSGDFLGSAGDTSWYHRSCEEGFPVWLGEKQYALGVVCFIGIWQSFGFNMVLYLAGLTSIPSELYHAAELDGARSPWQRFVLVTWPMLGPTTVFVVTITCIRSFQVFDTVEALFSPGGGPGKTAYVMLFAIFDKAIKQNLVGLGAAITVMFLIFVLLITLVQRSLLERRTHYV